MHNEKLEFLEKLTKKQLNMQREEIIWYQSRKKSNWFSSVYIYEHFCCYLSDDVESSSGCL